MYNLKPLTNNVSYVVWLIYPYYISLVIYDEEEVSHTNQDFDRWCSCDAPRSPCVWFSYWVERWSRRGRRQKENSRFQISSCNEYMLIINKKSNNDDKYWLKARDFKIVVCRKLHSYSYTLDKVNHNARVLYDQRSWRCWDEYSVVQVDLNVTPPLQTKV